jgi:hypothetical protein
VMIKTDPLFPDNVRVKLRDGVNPNFYGGYGLPGNEGWIRRHHAEEYGFQRVLIEWDKDHWSYNGAENGWTWENHFELVEDEMSNENQDEALANLGANFAKEVAKIVQSDTDANKVEDSVPSGKGISEVIDAERAEANENTKGLSFDQTLRLAHDAAGQADAFILIAVKKRQLVEGVETILPVIYHAADDLQSSLVCNMQVGHWMSNFTDRLAEEKLFASEGND